MTTSIFSQIDRAEYNIESAGPHQCMITKGQNIICKFQSGSEVKQIYDQIQVSLSFTAIAVAEDLNQGTHAEVVF